MGRMWQGAQFPTYSAKAPSWGGGYGSGYDYGSGYGQGSYGYVSKGGYTTMLPQYDITDPLIWGGPVPRPVNNGPDPTVDSPTVGRDLLSDGDLSSIRIGGGRDIVNTQAIRDEWLDGILSAGVSGSFKYDFAANVQVTSSEGWVGDGKLGSWHMNPYNDGWEIGYASAYGYRSDDVVIHLQPEGSAPTRVSPGGDEAAQYFKFFKVTFETANHADDADDGVAAYYGGELVYDSRDHAGEAVGNGFVEHTFVVQRVGRDPALEFTNATTGGADDVEGAGALLTNVSMFEIA